jgi:hypothetical protein
VSTMLWLELPAGRLEAAARWFAALPQTRMCAVMVGAANLTAYLTVHHLPELRSLEQELSHRFPEARIRDRQLTLRTLKLVGRLLDPDGRAHGCVPLDPWAPWGE